MENRELDALVAEKVMGFQLNNKVVDWLAYPIRNGVVDYFEPTIVPHYSTDIAAAWLVVDHFADTGQEVSVSYIVRSDNHNNLVGSWVCDVGPGNGLRFVLTVAAESAPLAICLAALRAAGVEVGE